MVQLIDPSDTLISWGMTNKLGVDMSEYKRCARCRKILEPESFGSHTRYKDGKQPSCKQCTTEYRLDWKHKKLLVDPDYFNRESRERRLKNPEAVRQYKKEWRDKNLDKARNYAVDWARRNPGSVKRNSANWIANNPEKVAASKHSRRTRKLANGVFDVRESYIARLYASNCVDCGSNKNIELDHVMPISRGGAQSEGNLQPLCRFCNRSKGNKTMMEWRIKKIKRGA